MQLVVEVVTGTVFHITVEDDSTVPHLKIRIQVQENLTGDHIILLLIRDADHLLLDDELKRLSDYGVQDGSRLHADFEPPSEAEEENVGNNNDDDSDGGDASENEEENDGNNNDDDSDSSFPKTPSEETTVESPEYVDVSD
ncbi:hypothetical protein RND71_027521 [Anisodus tanguticus]|uniref:Ubiquitin-like domain-containing protein n=1 Tax=Anisodus tanguticus TaxID=243964 RepID=A0AAE1RHZ4_9SOLA|nr:hypothetical protein RND71_027521 [Anisodus tanguticus]